MNRPPLIAVLTRGNPRGSYLRDTLCAIDRNGGADVVRRVYVDGGEVDTSNAVARLRHQGVGRGWEWVSLGKRSGSTEATRRLLVSAAEDDVDVLFFEDDLVFCRNAVARMVAQEAPSSVGILTFFDMKEVRKGSAPGLYRRSPLGGDHSGFWGAQALKFPRDMVRWLADQDWYRTDFGRTQMASDQYLGHLVNLHPTRNRLAVHTPNLVQHVGHVSACFPGLGLTSWRRATNFPGREFDALSLPKMG